jgi:H+/Cl- antiporter ClcA
MTPDFNFLIRRRMQENTKIKNSKLKYYNFLKFFGLSKFSYLFTWIFISSLISIFVGSASAFFLISLDWITTTRENNFYLIYFLPLIGLLIGYFYHFYGKNIEAGNKLILQEYDKPKRIIPLKMAPMIYLGTIFTHLFGASAGREGTAIQMSASISDQFVRIFYLDLEKRRIILLCAIAAGFSSVFGTPFAGIIFAFELVLFKNISLKSILPVVLSSLGADLICELIGAKHTNYSILNVPELNFTTILYTLFAGLLFGLVAFIFIQAMKISSQFFQKRLKFLPFRTFFGGIIILILILSLNTTEFIGLGIPSIENSFHQTSDLSIFALKILFTVLTLSTGFKGGEVTPLFFIGATLGSALSLFLPLPVGFLAGIGFVAVFSGATKTPIACSIMGMELFGYEAGFLIVISCFTAFSCSGKSSIYGKKINFLKFAKQK